ncbi:uncharacterized protein [Euwallacea fornicatus]|uniref:uncharacterized protein n=1 Tax=Euwallacea fornicatus TaxID=995702 RepID=UPI00338FDA3F
MKTAHVPTRLVGKPRPQQQRQYHDGTACQEAVPVALRRSGECRMTTQWYPRNFVPGIIIEPLLLPVPMKQPQLQGSKTMRFVTVFEPTLVLVLFLLGISEFRTSRNQRDTHKSPTHLRFVGRRSFLSNS